MIQIKPQLTKKMTRAIQNDSINKQLHSELSHSFYNTVRI